MAIPANPTLTYLGEGRMDTGASVYFSADQLARWHSGTTAASYWADHAAAVRERSYDQAVFEESENALQTVSIQPYKKRDADALERARAVIRSLHQRALVGQCELFS